MTNPSRVVFSVFGRDIYWYGVLIAVSVLLAIFLATREAKRRGLNPDHILDFALLAIPCSIIFSRIYYVIFEWKQFADNLWRVFAIWEGGLAIYGVVIGGIIAAVIFCRWKKIKLGLLLDLCAPGLVLGQAIGRWGNYFNQEAFGPMITDPAWMWCPFAVRIDATDTVHMATFFYESLWCFAIFVFLMTQRRKFKHDGDAMLWYFALYAFERMFLEGLRQDSLWLIPGAIRVSQLLSLLILLAVIAFVLWRRSRERAGLWPPARFAAAAEASETPEDELAEAEATCNRGCGCAENDCDTCTDAVCETGVESGEGGADEPEQPDTDAADAKTDDEKGERE